MGRMITIEKFIEELQETRKNFGNTCVYIRDVSWGGMALNRQKEDEEKSIAPFLAKIEPANEPDISRGAKG